MSGLSEWSTSRKVRPYGSIQNSKGVQQQVPVKNVYLPEVLNVNIRQIPV